MFFLGALKLGFDFIAGRAIAVFNMRMQIATFIIDRWRVFLVLAILALVALHYISLRNQLNVLKNETIVLKKRAFAAENAIIDYVATASEAAKKRDAENVARRTESDKAISIAMQERNEALKQVGLLKVNRDTLKRNLENEKSYLADVLNNAYELRVNANAANSAGVREVARSSEEVAESARNCERTLVTVTQACQATTIDYNILRAYNDENCKIYGCRPADDEPIIDFGSIEKVD